MAAAESWNIKDKHVALWWAIKFSCLLTRLSLLFQLPAAAIKLLTNFGNNLQIYTMHNLSMYFFHILAFIAYLTLEHGVYVPPGPKWNTRVANFVNFICFMTSTLLILSMTFERFYSIKLPHKAASFNTVKRAKITVACIAVVSILYNIPRLYVTSNVYWEYIPYGNSNEYSFGEFYYWLSTVVHFRFTFHFIVDHE